MLAFALVATALMHPSSVAALPVALAAWAVVSLGVYSLMRLLLRVFGERQYMPEVSTSEGVPVVQSLIARNLTLGLAESCTGGFIAALLTSIPGAGDVVRGGAVTYSDVSKQLMLGVPRQLIEDRGAVSAAVAREMAIGVKHRLQTDVGLAVTGLLGGPQDGDAAGETYIALCTADDRVLLRHYSDDHGPGRNRERDVRMALRLVIDGVSGEPL